MDEYEEEIKKKEEFENAIVTRKDDETIRVETEEGYVYEITEDEVEYIGEREGPAPPDLQESDIEFIATPSKWTKTEVEVEIKTKIEGYILQYSKDGTSWTNYTTSITMTDNGAIYARLTNNLEETGGYATGNVTNIDRLAPNEFTPTVTSTTNSITLSGSTTDATKTETDGCSGIDKYYFSKNNGETWEPTEGQEGSSYTFTRLTQNQVFNLKMKVVDKAGNETITSTVTKNTGTVTGLTSSNVTFSYSPSTPTRGSVAVTISTAITGYTLQYSKDGTNWSNYVSAITMTNNGAVYARLWDGVNGGGYATGNVTFSYNPSGWTKGNVAVSISTTVKGYTLQYSTNNSTWNNYSSAITMTNNGAIYARLKDSTGQVGGTATGNVTNIDKTAPSVSISTGNITSSSAKLTVSASDGQSGLATSGTYRYYLGNSLVATTTSNSYTYGNLATGVSYTLKVIVSDKAGNTTEKSTTIKTVLPLPTGSTIIGDGIIRDANNNEWVWIEVPKSIYPSSTTKTSYSAIESAMQSYASAYRQSGCVDTWYNYGSVSETIFESAAEYNNWKNSMLSSVFENGGFFIGRYEVGVKWPRISSSQTGTVQPLIQRDKYPYNYVMPLHAQSEAKNLSTGGKQASLMFGIQWDLVLKYIEVKGGKTQAQLKSDSTTWGNYENATFDVKRAQGLYAIYPSGVEPWKTTSNYTKPASQVLLTTGASDRNCVLGIYDLAGNVWERTLEREQSCPYTIRGGTYDWPGDVGSAFSRFIYGGASDDFLATVGFRAALW